MRIFIIVIICLGIGLMNTIRVKKEYSMEDMKKCIKMGDVILFRSTDVTFMHDYLTPFTHVGIIVEIGGEKKILEIHSEGDVKHMGLECKNVVVYDFETRVLYYDGEIYCLKLRERLSDETKEDFIVNKLPGLRKKKFYKDYINYTRNNCVMRNRNTKGRGKMFCSEFIGHCLQQLGVISGLYNISCLFPGDFRSLKRGSEGIFCEVIKLNKYN